MFDKALLDSSPERTPVLRRRHRALCLLCGAGAGTLAAWLIPYFFAVQGPRILVLQAVLAGVLAFVYALMACYTWADARHLGLNRAAWLAVVLALNLPGFLAYLFYSASRSGEWRRISLPLAYAAEVMVVAVLILIPLIKTQALPALITSTLLPAPPMNRPAPPPGEVRQSRPTPHPAVDINTIPTFVPTHIVQVVEEPQPPRMSDGNGPYIPGAPVGPQGYIPGALRGADWMRAANPPPPPAPKPHPALPVRVSMGVQAAKLIFGPTPDYPPLARISRVQGTVRLEAIISRDGSIESLKVASGPALLVKAAVEAVSRWRYQPTLLSGEPVEVSTQIDVNFTLAD
jgi:periplasmic protein TonB